MTSLDAALAALNGHPVRATAAAWPSKLEGLDQPGLYAWWVDAAGAEDLSRSLGVGLSAGCIYVGQAGASSATAKAQMPSGATLGSRIEGNHLRGRVRGSTLRCTLASILLGPLALNLVGPRRLDAASEARLSEWIRRHLSITVSPVDCGEHLAELKEQVVVSLRPPLNLDHLPTDDLRRRLRDLRAIVTHNIDDLWVAPDPALAGWRKIIAEYGQSFDGYRYAGAVRKDCPAIADEVWRRYRAEGHFTSSFAELRCALFWLQRWVHNAEQAPGWTADAELETDVRRLYAAIQEIWRGEHGRGLGGMTTSGV